MKTPEQQKYRPFLKWAGGKYHIAERIQQSLPSGGRLIEPFAGAGSIFLNTSFDKYLVNDINQDLIQVYQYLKKEKHKFIEYCRSFFIEQNNEKTKFVELRTLFNQTEEPRLKAALFIYLNRHAFNGLMRYNQTGEFNTSFGSYKKPYFPEKEMLYFAEKLKKARLSSKNFACIMRQAKKGDIVYCDPPYMPLSLTANFTSYHSSSFGLKEQEQLADLAKELANKSIPVIISNHDTALVKELYKDAQLDSFEVPRFISCNVNNRKKAKEVLAFFG